MAEDPKSSCNGIKYLIIVYDWVVKYSASLVGFVNTDRSYQLENIFLK